MREKIEGCLFGTAIGDALGAPAEFLDYASIHKRFGESGIRDLKGTPALVTDDTQMALAVGRALIQSPRPYTMETMEPVLRREFNAWYHDEKNNRAPGMTCMTSIERLMTTPIWQLATNMGSKGCGANMRVQPVALLPEDDATRAGIAQFQAALTHAHGTALASADITAAVIHYLARDGDVSSLLEWCKDYAESQHRVYHENWLGDLYQRAYQPDATSYISYGWDEVINVIHRVESALKNPDYEADPCIATGAGWIAEEAFSTALFCFLLYPDEPAGAIIRGANSSGDSDSIACIAGSFAGAYHGISAWKSDWLERIEYKEDLQKLANDLFALYL